MKKLTELQVLKALDILHFQDIPENRADLQRVSKELQYDTTSTERPCVGYPDCDGDLPGEGHSAGCPAAQPAPEYDHECGRTCADDGCVCPCHTQEPAPVDGDLAERALSIYTEYCRAKIPLRENDRVEAMAAVIRLIKQDSNARWEKALRDHPGPAISEQAIEWVRARIEANPKTLEERIAELEHQLAEEKKDFDALDDQYHRLGEKYEALQWKPITLENLPKAGDEASGQDKMSLFANGSFRNLLRVVTDNSQTHTSEEWHRLGYHYFRAINLPVQTPEAADAPPPHD